MHNPALVGCAPERLCLCPQPSLTRPSSSPQDSELRRRAGRKAAADGGASRGASEKLGRPSVGGSARPYGWALPLLLAALFAGLYVLGHHVEERHPEPGELEVNARRFLRRLVALGPRICGSEENERQAVQVSWGHRAGWDAAAGDGAGWCVARMGRRGWPGLG